MSSPMGIYLRQLGGGPVEIMLRVHDFALRVDPEKQVGGSGQELIAFAANGFREVAPDADVWEFDVMEKTSSGHRRLRVGVAGSDIVVARVEGRVAP